MRLMQKAQLSRQKPQKKAEKKAAKLLRQQQEEQRAAKVGRKRLRKEAETERKRLRKEAKAEHKRLQKEAVPQPPPPTADSLSDEEKAQIAGKKAAAEAKRAAVEAEKAAAAAEAKKAAAAAEVQKAATTQDKDAMLAASLAASLEPKCARHLLEGSPRSPDSTDDESSSLKDFIVETGSETESEAESKEGEEPAVAKPRQQKKRIISDDDDDDDDGDAASARDARANEVAIIESMRASALKAKALAASAKPSTAIGSLAPSVTSTAARTEASAPKKMTYNDIPSGSPGIEPHKGLLRFFQKTPALGLPTSKAELQHGAGGYSSNLESDRYSIYYTGRQAVLRPSGLFTSAEFLKLMGYPPSACVRQVAIKHGALMKGDKGQWFVPRDNTRSEEQVLLRPVPATCACPLRGHIRCHAPPLCLTCVVDYC